jgi:hypothetical protein
METPSGVSDKMPIMPLLRRPRWRSWQLQLACWGLFLLALGGAMAVHGHHLALRRTSFSGWREEGPLRVPRLVGWTEQILDDRLVYLEPDRRGVPGRRIEVFRRPCPEFISPLEYLARSEDVAGQFSGDDSIRWLRMCGWPGVMVCRQRAVSTAGQWVAVQRIMVAAAVLPSGESLVVRLQAWGSDVDADRELIRRLAESILIDQAPFPRQAGDLQLAADMSVSVPLEFGVASAPLPLRTDRRLVQLGGDGWMSLALVPLWVPPGEDDQSLAERMLLRDPLFDGRETEQLDERTWVCRRSDDHPFPAAAYLRIGPGGRALIAEFRWSAGWPVDIAGLWNQISLSLVFGSPPQSLQSLMEAGERAVESLPADSANLFGRQPAVCRWQRFYERFPDVVSIEELTEITDMLVRSQTLMSVSPDTRRPVEGWSITRDWNTYENVSFQPGAVPVVRRVRISAGDMTAVVFEGERVLAAGESMLGPFVPGGLIAQALGVMPYEPMALRTDPSFGSPISAVTPLLVMVEPASDMLRLLADQAEPLRCWSVTVNGSGESLRCYYDSQGRLRFVAMAGGCNLTRVDSPGSPAATQSTSEPEGQPD